MRRAKLRWCNVRMPLHSCSWGGARVSDPEAILKGRYIMSKRLLWVPAAMALVCMPFGCGSDDDGGGSGGGNTGAVSGTGGTGGGSGGSGGGSAGSGGGTAGSGGGTAGSGGTAGASGSAGASGNAGSSGASGAAGSAGTGGGSGSGGTGGTGGATGGTGGATGGTGGATGGTGGATGGTGGTGGGPNVSCQKLDSDYQKAVLAAKSCTIQPSNQCTTKVGSALGCPCDTYINNANAKALSQMKAAKAAWNGQGCTAPIVCKKCPAVSGAKCLKGSGSVGPLCTDAAVSTGP